MTMPIHRRKKPYTNSKFESNSAEDLRESPTQFPAPCQLDRGYGDTKDSEDLDDSEDTEETEVIQKGMRGLHRAISSDQIISREHRSTELFKAGKYTELTLRTFIKLAAKEIGNSDSTWKSATWEFVRLCKSHPQLTALTADEAMNMIPWQQTNFEEEEQLQFLAEWNKVRLLPGVKPLDWAAEMARQKPIKSSRPFPLYNRFLSIAGWLQTLLGNGAIFLPCHAMGNMLGCSHTTVASMRQLAIKDKLLEVVEAHSARRATRFKFAVDRCPILAERQ